MAQKTESVDFSIYWHSPSQQEIFACKTKNITVRCGRRYGKTKGAMQKMASICILQKDSKHLWVDVTQGNIEKYFDEHMRPILDSSLYHWNKQQKILTFHKGIGSVVHFGSIQKPENLEGFGYHYVWLNEAGIILKGTKGEKLWNNTIRPMTIEYGGAQVWFIGTPKGQGLFSDFIKNGQDPNKPDWIDFHRTSYDNPLIGDKEIDELVEDLPARSVRQEIFAEVLDDDDSDPIISYEVGKKALDTVNPHTEDYNIIWGLDVAMFGDDNTALCKRRFNYLYEQVKMIHGLDTIQISEWLQKDYVNAPDNLKPHEILVDAHGVGAGVYDQCKRLGLPVRRVMVSNKPLDTDKFFQKRDELWDKARKWLVDGGSINGDRELFIELIKPVHDREFFERHGKLKVESKKNMRKRLGAEGHSPDKGDAFVLTFAAGVERKRKPVSLTMKQKLKGTGWAA
ncbi:hypothetical protein LCGC14_2367220 [marine sediment metagenome]|uniref:Uncharacterized protein n=1 Tax=marine sediment metagenome TaxID=412755 RepID=A0A0F9C549_9ZZZZ